MYRGMDGLYFDRDDDAGSVRIVVELPPKWGEVEFIIPAETWASIVATVSAQGENAQTVSNAEALHMLNIPLMVLPEKVVETTKKLKAEGKI